MQKSLSCVLIAIICGLTVTAQELPSDTVWVHDTLDVPAEPSDTVVVHDALAILDESCDSVAVKPHPWRAMGELMVTNVAIFLLDRYILHEPFSYISMNTVRQNFKSGFAWDDDNFYVNQIGHAYQGGVNFNTARSNGMDFWTSIPYTTVGSIVWEFLGENEQPSINDVITTTMVGTLVGEVSYRMSQHFIDENARGGKRFVIESVAALLNPIEGVHRLISGRMWRVAKNGDTCNDKTDATGNLTVGARYVWPNSDSSQGFCQPILAFGMEYGQIGDGESHFKPYDLFSLDGSFAFGRKQHLLSHLHLIGRICSTPVFMNKKMSGELGLYQFFHYEDTKIMGDSTRSVFPFGEMASVGPGLLLSFPQIAPRIKAEQRLFLKGVLLGAVKSDYYKFYNRSYNMGSGFGALSNSKLTWDKIGSVQLRAYYMNLFTWKGYEPRDLNDLVFESNYLNVLGDRSDARVFALNLQMYATLSKNMGISLGSSFYSRHTHYKYYQNQRVKGYEIKAGIEWHL